MAGGLFAVSGPQGGCDRLAAVQVFRDELLLSLRQVSLSCACPHCRNQSEPTGMERRKFDENRSFLPRKGREGGKIRLFSVI